MQTVAPRMEALSADKFVEEWRKLLLKSNKPSIGLILAQQLGILQYIQPEMPPLIGTQQDPKHHPEGDAWIHTLMVIDEMAKIVRREKLLEKNPNTAFILSLAAMCHDLGKPTSTQISAEKTTSYGHEKSGLEPTQKFLEKIKATMKSKKVLSGVSHATKLTLCHRIFRTNNQRQSYPRFGLRSLSGDNRRTFAFERSGRHRSWRRRRNVRHSF